MSRITLDLPDEVLMALKLSPDELRDELLVAASMKLYEMGRLSSGAAAHLAGMPKAVFLTQLADYGVDALRQSEDELRRETRLA